jgi:hypothetical protein
VCAGTSLNGPVHELRPLSLRQMQARPRSRPCGHLPALSERRRLVVAPPGGTRPSGKGGRRLPHALGGPRVPARPRARQQAASSTGAAAAPVARLAWARGLATLATGASSGSQVSAGAEARSSGLCLAQVGQVRAR